MPHINHRRGESRRSVHRGTSYYSGWTSSIHEYKSQKHVKMRQREREIIHRMLKGETVEIFPLYDELANWWDWD